MEARIVHEAKVLNKVRRAERRRAQLAAAQREEKKRFRVPNPKP
jgi:hypothetical protein